MLYAERDRDGKLVAIRKKSPEEEVMVEPISQEELVEFLTDENGVDASVSLLRSTDMRVIRVLEDLIDTLIAKNVIMLTDLPDDAQLLISTRKKARQRMQNFRLVEGDIL